MNAAVPKFDNDLTNVAARLALAAPREWGEFIAGFAKYAGTQRDLLVQASNDDLQRTQGRAQQCTQILTLLNDAVTAANRAYAQAGSSKPKP